MYFKKIKKSVLLTIVTLIISLSSLLIPNKAYSADIFFPNTYTVKSGDTLWLIYKSVGVPIADIKAFNNLSSDYIYPGQILNLKKVYTVQVGDTLWKIGASFGVTVDYIVHDNNLSSTVIYPGQKLYIPKPITPNTPAPAPSPPAPSWPSVTYIVQSGDTASSIASKFGTTASLILKYNYLNSTDWFSAGQKIAINGYAPRLYTVTPNQFSSPTATGSLVDWFLEGQYILKRNDVFTIVDYYTRKQLTVKMLGGYNHCDIEPLTTDDTNTLFSLFGNKWGWNGRPVIIFKDGMCIAGSLSGMPHSFEGIYTNGVTGHFDLYLLNSTPHSPDTSTEYVAQHQTNVLKAAGK